MPTHLVAAAAARSRLVLLLTVAVLTGAAGGTWAVSAAAGPRVTVATVADDDRATRGDDGPGPAKATGPQPRGAHGACVAAVARGAATGGKNDNHGGAVSRAAHTCAKPVAGTAKGKPAKPTPAQTP